MVLQISRSQPQSVFELLGSNENSATFALGWTLNRSPKLLAAFLTKLGVSADPKDVLIHLQRFGEDKGFSDIELISPNNFHIIVEAKRGWILPSREQLMRYRPRLDAPIGKRLMVTVSAASREYAQRQQVLLDDLQVLHLSWDEILAGAKAARFKTHSSFEKLWLAELIRHINGYTIMQRADDNIVWIVSLSGQPIHSDRTYTWIDVVEVDRSYFHPMGPGSGWPAIPPNYIGFRYGGLLKSVHHIDDYQVADDLVSLNSNWPIVDKAHYVYSLGPPMYPRTPLRSGSIVRNTRVRCAIDTLLSGAFGTIDAAFRATNDRIADLNQ